MPSTKKITITEDQAENIEQLMGDYLSEPGPISLNDEDFSVSTSEEVRHFLKEHRVPVKVINTVLSRLEDIGGDINNMQMNGEVNRDAIDAVSDGLKSLDELMGKLFNVKRSRKTKKPYPWQVWG